MRAFAWIGLVALAAAGCGGSSESSTERAFVEATAAEHAGDSPEPSPFAAGPVDVPLLEQELAYGETEGANLTGYLAMPRDAIEPLPGLVVIHEWWGLNDNIRAVTRRLAAEGYIVLAVDLYGGAVAEDPERAEALMSALAQAPDRVRHNLRQAYEYLDEYALSPQIGAIGWCLGGGWALQTALMLPGELDAAVMYYGRIETDEARLAGLSVPVLGLFGARDESIPAAGVRAWRSRLRDMGKDVEIYVYPEAGHAFANPSGGSYAPEAALDAWDRTLEFLARRLQ